jgi:hypothetical protein
MANAVIRINTQQTQPVYPLNRPIIITTPINASAELGIDINGNTTVFFHTGQVPSINLTNNTLDAIDIGILSPGIGNFTDLFANNANFANLSLTTSQSQSTVWAAPNNSIGLPIWRQLDIAEFTINDNSAFRQTIGLDDLAIQSSTNINISGGHINGTVIGDTDAVAATFTLLTSGDHNINGVLNILGNKILGGRVTGWGIASNGSRATFDASTATLSQTAAALAQLIIDLTNSHRLLGA